MHTRRTVRSSGCLIALVAALVLVAACSSSKSSSSPTTTAGSATTAASAGVTTTTVDPVAAAQAEVALAEKGTNRDVDPTPRPAVKGKHIVVISAGQAAISSRSRPTGPSRPQRRSAGRSTSTTPSSTRRNYATARAPGHRRPRRRDHPRRHRLQTRSSSRSRRPRPRASPSWASTPSTATTRTPAARRRGCSAPASTTAPRAANLDAFTESYGADQANYIIAASHNKAKIIAIQDPEFTVLVLDAQGLHRHHRRVGRLPDRRHLERHVVRPARRPDRAEDPGRAAAAPRGQLDQEPLHLRHHAGHRPALGAQDAGHDQRDGRRGLPDRARPHPQGQGHRRQRHLVGVDRLGRRRHHEQRVHATSSRSTAASAGPSPTRTTTCRRPGDVRSRRSTSRPSTRRRGACPDGREPGGRPGADGRTSPDAAAAVDAPPSGAAIATCRRPSRAPGRSTTSRSTCAGRDPRPGRRQRVGQVHPHQDPGRRVPRRRREAPSASTAGRSPAERTSPEAARDGRACTSCTRTRRCSPRCRWPRTWPSATASRRTAIGAHPVAGPAAAHPGACSSASTSRATPDTLVRVLRPAERAMVAIARALQDQEGEQTGRAGARRADRLAAPRRGGPAAWARSTASPQSGQTILFVSHRLDEVIDTADRATVLRDGRLAGTLEGDDITETRLIELIAGRALDRTCSRRCPRSTSDEVVLEAHGSLPAGRCATSTSSCARARCSASPACSGRAAPSC